MKRIILAFVFSGLVLAAGGQDASAEPKPGDRASSGNLIVHVFHSVESGRPIPAELETDFGFMVFNLGDEAHPRPKFRLASRAAGTVQDFETLASFTAALAKVPKGSMLYHYDKCLVPTSYGLHFDWHGFQRTCQRLGLQIAEDSKITCNCPEK